MKIRLVYTPEEREEAAAVLAALLRNHPGARVHESDAKPQHKCIYLTVKKSAMPTDAKKRG